MENSIFTGTSTDADNLEIDINKTLKKAEEIHQEMLRNMASMFKGIEVRVDPELEGERYYVSMSQELYERLNMDWEKAEKYLKRLERPTNQVHLNQCGLL